MQSSITLPASDVSTIPAPAGLVTRHPRIAMEPCGRATTAAHGPADPGPGGFGPPAPALREGPLRPAPPGRPRRADPLAVVDRGLAAADLDGGDILVLPVQHQAGQLHRLGRDPDHHAPS